MESTMMHGNITGIDISAEQITAVQTGSGLKGRRILACTRIPLEEGGLEKALRSLAGSMDLRHDSCLVTIPDDLVSFRNVGMPFSDRKKIGQALPFEVEGMLPYPIEELLIDFVPTGGRSDGGVLAASVRRDAFSNYLTTLQSCGIDPEVLEVRGSPLASWILEQPEVPDHVLVLEAGDSRHTLVICLNRRIALIRSFIASSASPVSQNAADKVSSHPPDRHPENIGPIFRHLCAEVHHTVHAFISSEGITDRPKKVFFTGEPLQAPLSADVLSRCLNMPAEPIDVGRDKRMKMEEGVAGSWSPALMNSALSLALRNPAKREGFNFRKDEFGRKGQYLRIRKAAPKMAILLFLILGFLAADMIIDTYALKREYQSLDREITTIFRQVLPQVTRVIDPVQQLRVSVEEMKRSSVSRPVAGRETTILDLLREISERLPPSIRLQVYRMVVDPETVRVSGKTEAFNEVDRIKNELTSSKMFGAVNITSANLDRTGNKVQFEITIERKR